jgi:hypothetical protein
MFFETYRQSLWCVANGQSLTILTFFSRRKKMMRKMSKSTLICVVVGLSFAISIAQAATVITDAAGLQAMNDNLAGDYVLGADIDLTGFAWQRVGPFTGTFDGAYHTISGLTMDADRANLFSTVAEGGEIKNVGLSNFNLRGGWYVGALVGSLYGTVSNCFAIDGTVTGAQGDYGNVGTLIGLIRETGSVSDCYSTMDLILEGGGFSEYSGGFTGGVAGPATNCYFAGTIAGDAGSFAGYINENLATSCYYDTDVTGILDGDLGRTTAEMMQESTYVGWDFDNVWSIDEGQGYPTLRMFPIAITIDNPGFEDPVLDEDGWTWLETLGWTNVGDGGSGIWNVTSDNFDPVIAPEGENVFYTENAVGEVGGVTQVLTDTFAADTDYMLTVEIGNSWYYYFSGYSVQLLAGGVVIAEDNDTLWPDYYKWATSAVVYTYDPADSALVGQPLEIRLLNLGLDKDSPPADEVVGVEFDNVSLSYVPAPPAPVSLITSVDRSTVHQVIVALSVYLTATQILSRWKRAV